MSPRSIFNKTHPPLLDIATLILETLRLLLIAVIGCRFLSVIAVIDCPDCLSDRNANFALGVPLGLPL